jgi:glycosyltransferase involved in cell wall biosynthesis
LSNYGRDDLVQTYGIPADRIDVIPLAAASRFSPVESEKDLQRVRQTYGIDGDYILCVGSIQPRKNLARLITAYSRLRSHRSERRFPKLVIVGKRAWLYDETLRAIEKFELTRDVILTGYVPETDLPALYSSALCFVYPSYFEGFGIPPLEAMSCGVPVLVGNKTSLPEVVGDAALQVDPFDVDAIQRGIEKLVHDQQFRLNLRSKGFAHVKRFCWEETARKTINVYAKAVAEAELAHRSAAV